MDSPTLPEIKPIDTGPLEHALSEIRRTRLELGTTRAEMAAEEIEDARINLMEALKLLDTTEDRDCHVRLLSEVAALDDLCAVLKERGRG